MDNLESNISISDSTADGPRSDPYLRDELALPKFEPESLDEYNARRLAQCKEKLRALLFGMFTQTGKDTKFFDQDIEEVFMGWAEQVVCLPPSRLLDALSEQQNVLRELDYDLPTAGGGTADNGRFLTFTEHQYGSVMCIFMRELLIRTIVRYTMQRSYVSDQSVARLDQLEAGFFELIKSMPVQDGDKLLIDFLARKLTAIAHRVAIKLCPSSDKPVTSSRTSEPTAKTNTILASTRKTRFLERSTA